jgi:TolB-like protein
MNLHGFFAELRRRNIYKVAVAYAVVGWLVIQAASILLPTFEAPAWAMKVIVLLLVLGFPAALIFSWAFEITPEGIVRETEVEPNRSIRHHTGRKIVALTSVVALIAAGLFVFQMLRARSKSSEQPTASALPNNSIAVLPFRNLSEEKANAFFAFGIQDEIITALAKISGLKVTSRTSAGHYESSPKNLSQVAQELRVANILEGSVQKAGDRVHINVQLIRAETDEHLWAQSYDRALTDIFSVEAEVAQNVATSLKAALSPEEKARVEAKPTNNPEAYLLYLRGREYQTRPTGLLQDYQTAAELYGRAIALDPAFALAHARLATTLAYTYLNFQPTDELKDRARAEAEAALKLQPDLGEAHLAYALCLYWTEKDYASALYELGLARKLRPNDAEIDYFTGAIRRRQGQWAEAVASIERASARDPRNSLFAREVLLTRWMMRDWKAAARGGDRAVALAPDLPLLKVERSYVDIWARGDLGPLNAALAAIPAGVDPDGEVTLARWDAALLARDFTSAERVVTAASSETLLTPFGTPLPKAYLLGCIALARGDLPAAQPFFDTARPKMEADAAAFPLDPFRQAQLGLLYAFVDSKEDALRQGHRAVEILPESKDAFYGSCLSALLALIYARTGEADEALRLIERLLTIPGPVSQVFDGSMTINDLRLRWQWDSLRNDARFRQIVDGEEPQTTYR